MSDQPPERPYGEHHPLLEPNAQDPNEERFALSLAQWDRHMARCADCLSHGMELCDEGAELRLLVERSRMARDRALAKAERSHASHPRQVGRPTGAPADASPATSLGRPETVA